MEDVGGNLGGIIGDLMSKGQQPRVVYDNFDFRITPGQLTKDHQNTDNHWISQFITFDRIDSSGLDNSKPSLLVISVNSISSGTSLAPYFILEISLAVTM